MSAAVRSSPLFHGSTSATASREAGRATALEHRLDVPGGLLDRPPLHDVVDPALDDEHVGTRQDEVEPARDLVRALAVDRGRAELEPRVGLRRPPLPLAALVGRRDPRANGGVRIPERRAGRDRVAGDRHHDPGQVQPGNSLLLARLELDDELAIERLGDAEQRVDPRRPSAALEPRDRGLRRAAELGELALRESHRAAALGDSSAICAKNQPRSPATIRSWSRSSGPFASARARAAMCEA